MITVNLHVFIMDLEEAILAVSIATVTTKLIHDLRVGLIQKRTKKRRWWTKPNTIRKEDKDIHTGEEDPDVFRKGYGMDHLTFLKLLRIVEGGIKRKNTAMRDSISPKLRLSITLKYLATGESLKSLSDRFGVSLSTIYGIIPDTCQAIYDILKNDYLKVPSTKQEWIEVAKQFEKELNYPNCLGALNRKCIVFKLRPYQKKTDIIITALVDSEFKFLFVDVSFDDEFPNSVLDEMIKENILDFPLPSKINGTEYNVPYHIIAGDSFPLSQLFIRPYKVKSITEEEKLYNYRFNRGLKSVENAFSIMANNFQILLQNSVVSSEKAEIIILACCALHNFLITEQKDIYFQNMTVVEDTDTCTLAYPEERNFKTLKCNYRAKLVKEGKILRDVLKDYFNDPGLV